MVRESYQSLIALLALTVCGSVAKADSVSVSGSCIACQGSISGAHADAFGFQFSTSSDLTAWPGISAEFQLPWILVVDAGQFTSVSSDGSLTISGAVTAINVTTTPVFNQPLIYFSTATDSVQWINGTGEAINIPQTGAGGSGSIGSMGGHLQGTFGFGFDLPATSAIPEPGTMLLLTVGLLGSCLCVVAANRVRSSSNY